MGRGSEESHRIDDASATRRRSSNWGSWPRHGSESETRRDPSALSAGVPGKTRKLLEVFRGLWGPPETQKWQERQKTSDLEPPPSSALVKIRS